MAAVPWDSFFGDEETDGAGDSAAPSEGTATADGEAPADTESLADAADAEDTDTEAAEAPAEIAAEKAEKALRLKLVRQRCAARARAAKAKKARTKVFGEARRRSAPQRSRFGATHGCGCPSSLAHASHCWALLARHVLRIVGKPST